MLATMNYTKILNGLENDTRLVLCIQIMIFLNEHIRSLGMGKSGIGISGMGISGMGAGAKAHDFSIPFLMSKLF